MTQVIVQNFSLSLDGYAAGPRQSPEHPLGVGGDLLHRWMFPEDGPRTAVDERFAARFDQGVGATIMGRNMFGPIRDEWPDDGWRGWWARTRPSTTTSSSSPTTRAIRCRWPAGRRSPS
jgi:dihydrofolate reductase